MRFGRFGPSNSTLDERKKAFEILNPFGDTGQNCISVSLWCTIRNTSFWRCFAYHSAQLSR